MKKYQLQNLILDNLSVSVILLDKDLRVIYISPSAESLLDISSARMTGKLISNFLFSCDDNLSSNELNLGSLKNIIGTSHPFIQREVSLQLLDKTSLTIDLTSSPFIFGSKKMLLLELQPLERLLQMSKEKELLSAHDATRKIVRGLAHEIKNPLGGIKGAAQLLSDDLNNRPELREFTDIISKETERLCKLVDQLLGPNVLPKFCSVNIHEIVEHVTSLVTKEAMGKLVIDKNYDPSIPEIIGDKGQLTQAFLNIMRNAVQALSDSVEKNPKIWIKTRIERNFTIRNINHRMVCCVEIIDNGPGIPEEICDRIFFPMVSGKSNGTGLGLSISQSAIDIHQGLISFENRAKRTIFYTYLPLDK